MKRLLAMVIVLCAATPALGWPSWFAPEAPQTPHPAVARVIAIEGNGMSMGSGTLVAVTATHGLVITNWHVVRDATGPVGVVFPDGFRSFGQVLRVDRVWDLAALAIQRPNVQPVPLSLDPPRMGDALTIAGYGPKGQYRAATGRCTNYFSPGGNYPREWVEVSVGARQGDSGGPILNQRGELAGVLFGSGMGDTMGAYCGRVRSFLASTTVDFERLPGSQTLIAQQPSAPRTAPSAAIAAPASPQVANNWPDNLRQARDGAAPAAPLQSPAASRDGPDRVAAAATWPTASPARPTGPLPTQRDVTGTSPPVASALPPVAVATPAPSPLTAEAAAASRAEQIKTILAAIGLIALLFQGIRLVGAAVG